METGITVQFDAQRAEAMLREQPKRTERAVMRSLNRAIASAKTLMASLVAKDMGLKVSVAKDAITLREATPARLEARIGASLKRLPLIKFNAKGPIPSRGQGRGVTYRIGARGRSRVETGFIATMRNGHQGVFRRLTKARLPIVELRGPSIGHVFDAHRTEVTEKAIATFNERLGHEMAFAATEGGA